MSEARRGVVVRCDLSGTLTSIVRDDLNVISGSEGASFISLLDDASVQKGLQFLERTRAERASFEWELDLRHHDGPVHLRFAGGVVADGLFLVGAESTQEMERFYAEIVGINNEQANLLRSLMKERTERKRQDESLLNDMSQLNNELANLQRELTRKNLELKRLNERKNELLGMAAHDLRNPLGVIKAYAMFLHQGLRDELSEQQTMFLDRIAVSSQFMLRLVEDLLDISQIESGKLTLDRAEADLKALVSECVSLNAVLADPKKIHIEFSSPNDPVVLEMDGRKIEQVLNNLISNAVKYSHPETVVRVTVRCESGRATVSVRDEGQGIPDDELDRLFRPFGRTSVKSTGGEKSTGLGLVIVKKIVEGHGGEINVTSQVGVGSTFSFWLPEVPLPGA